MGYIDADRRSAFFFRNKDSLKRSKIIAEVFFMKDIDRNGFIISEELFITENGIEIIEMFTPEVANSAAMRKIEEFMHELSEKFGDNAS